MTYYPYYVRTQEDEWPEQQIRERHWALIEDATKVLYREDFLLLIRQFEVLRPWVSQAAEQHKS